MENQEEKWTEGDEEEEYYSFKEYDISASPNDFNIGTIFDYIEKGVFKIPGFQRNYVWDIKRASKLIESIIIGIPIPQIFLYEESKNTFLVIDGQQRLMTIYYFINGRFPDKDKRSELREIFGEHGKIPEGTLQDDNYFSDFKLDLPSQLPDRPNKLNKLNYSSLDDDTKNSMGLRTIRNIIIKQNYPHDDSIIYEIFNRLNTGGVNLSPQEIRTSLYHSEFFDTLYRINLDGRWRRLLKRHEPDLHMKDIEILLRGFAMLMNSDNYRPSMIKFLNNFSNSMKLKNGNDRAVYIEKVAYLENLFYSFLESCRNLDDNAFISKTARVNISMFEAIFTAVCKDAFQNNNLEVASINQEKLDNLKNNQLFINTTISQTTSKNNVAKRLELARQILLS
ncbi:MAG: DUF262 domain-containing protein [Nitrososphaeraceae archaeon]|nr:DUF262 domain-containing protein [Nitrososphaeraceae archaeon]